MYRGSRYRSLAPLLRLAPLLFLTVASGCTQEMWDHSRLKPLEGNAFFADGRSSRPLPEGVVARGSLVADGLRRYVDTRGNISDTLPFPLTAAVLDRGQDRYNAYCSACHGLTGYGSGIIVKRGYPPPPSYHSDRLRSAPLGHYVDVITNGYGVMYPYNDRVKPADRWAIAAYIRALQLSQNAPLSDVPLNRRTELESSLPGNSGVTDKRAPMWPDVPLSRLPGERWQGAPVFPGKGAGQ